MNFRFHVLSFTLLGFIFFLLGFLKSFLLNIALKSKYICEIAVISCKKNNISYIFMNFLQIFHISKSIFDFPESQSFKAIQAGMAHFFWGGGAQWAQPWTFGKMSFSVYADLLLFSDTHCFNMKNKTKISLIGCSIQKLQPFKNH